MRRVPGASGSLVSLLAVSVLAQAPPDPPHFRAGTTLIEFTVVVTGEDGRHVTDLKPQDVSIVERGRPREVAFFHYEGRRRRPSASEPSRCLLGFSPIARSTRPARRGTSPPSSSIR